MKRTHTSVWAQPCDARPVMRPRLVPGLILILAALIVVPAASPVMAANSASGSFRAGVAYYAVGKRACKLPKAGHMACFAMRRVVVAKGTPGARMFRPAAGITTNGVSSGRSATIGPAGGLTPSDLASAYAFSATTGGSGQTVAIVDAFNDPKINSDLQTFDTHYGLPTCSVSNGCLTIVNQSGGSTLPGNDTSGWSIEITLDVESVHSVCQKCKIILVEANSSASSALSAAENEAASLKATEITNSFGGAESQYTASDAAAFDHPGIVITASAGDDGYYDFDLLGSKGKYDQPNAPASLNTVVAVGGTSLSLGQTGSRQSESVWNDNGPRGYWEVNIGRPLGAGGGGCSQRFAAQGWQSHLGVWASTACGTGRLAGDIAAVADPLTGFDIYHSYNCGKACGSAGWSTYGGTSLASPIVAALYALAGGAQGVNYPALTLYGHLGQSSLYDVATGGNGLCDGEGAAQCGDYNDIGRGILDCDYPATGTTAAAGDRACDALPGYDGPTGVGTPKGLGAFAKTGPTATISGPTSAGHGTTVKWSATTKDPFPGGKVTKFTWSWGDGSVNTVTTSGSASHDYSSANVTRKVTVTVEDNYDQKGSKNYSVKVT